MTSHSAVRVDSPGALRGGNSGNTSDHSVETRPFLLNVCIYSNAIWLFSVWSRAIWPSLRSVELKCSRPKWRGGKLSQGLPIARTNYKDSRWIGGPAAASKISLALRWTLVSDQLPGGLHQQNWLKGFYCYSVLGIE